MQKDKIPYDNEFELNDMQEAKQDTPIKQNKEKPQPESKNKAAFKKKRNTRI